MPQQPILIQAQPPSVLLAVDHHHAAGPDQQMIDVGRRAGDGQVVQDRPAVPLQAAKQAGGAPLPGRPPPPRQGVGADPEPQHQAERGRDQQPGRAGQARGEPRGEHPDAGPGGEDGGGPPGQAAGPGRPLGGAAAPVLCLGGGAGSAHGGPHPHRHHRRRRGRPGGVVVEVLVVAVVVLVEVGEQRDQVGVAKRPDRQARLLVVAGRPVAIGVGDGLVHGCLLGCC
jgi:hypothetical protein